MRGAAGAIGRLRASRHDVVAAVDVDQLVLGRAGGPAPDQLVEATSASPSEIR